MKYVPGNIVKATQITTNVLVTPIFCLFLYALFIPFATALGAWAGTIAGVTTAVLSAYSGPIFGYTEAGLDPVSFMWSGLLAFIANIVVGCAVSLLFPNKAEASST